MSKPSGPVDVSALLRAARADVPTAADERALVAALEARIAGGAAGGGGEAPLDAYPPPPRAATRAWAIAAPIGVLGAIALWFVLRAPAPLPAAPAPVASAAPLVVPSAATGAAPPDEVPPAASPSPVSPSTMPHAVHAAPAPSEAALIESARAAVRREPARALALTDAHRRTFPRGELSPEREVIAIDALVRLGRRDEAVARANAFRAVHPRSIHTARIAAILGESENRPAH